MHIIDQYAYTNKIRAVHPAQEAGLALAVLFICLIASEPLVGVLAVGWMWGLATWVAGLSALTFGRVLLAELFFLALATLGVAMSLSLTPPGDQTLAVSIGPVWLISTLP